jgi:hypothetical protein
MPKLDDIVKGLFPNGTLGGDWVQAPRWPPDMFALVATLANMSGCYSRSEFTDQWLSTCFFDDKFRERVQTAGATWRNGKMPSLVEQLWSRLKKERNTDLLKPNAGWWKPAIELLSIADETSAGMGFQQPRSHSVFTDFVFEQHFALVRGKKTSIQVPKSLSMLVPASQVSVQPKTRTPQVGCSIRSLTHNLALLPPEGEIRTRWLLAPRDEPRENEPFNLLLFPFPFQIDGKCFFSERDNGPGPSRFFGLRQNWLGPPSTQQLLGALRQLLKAAEREVTHVHGLILPETALAAADIEKIASALAAQTDLEIFISGAYGPTSGQAGDSDNKVYMFVFANHQILNFWPQSKHHRWRLDGDQIRRYHLGDALDPDLLWWEKIALPPRECAFYVFRNGAGLASLVCEDLARIDPVQVALRSIGPNLVIVLLMDGPQLERRWPGRYATVFADDPGSAVLTLTSIGMVMRAAMPGSEQAHREIALWKEPGGTAKELWLPRGCHGLLLTLCSSWEKNFTLDGRDDGGATMQLSLSGVRPVRHPEPPRWLDENA